MIKEVYKSEYKGTTVSLLESIYGNKEEYYYVIITDPRSKQFMVSNDGYDDMYDALERYIDILEVIDVIHNIIN